MAINLQKVLSGYFSTAKLNSNFQKVEDSLNEDVLHRQNGSSVMQQDIDMNSNIVYNLKDPVSNSDAVNKKYIDDRIEDASVYADQANSFAQDSLSYSELAEDWATKTTGTVDGVEYSSKYYSQQSQQSADVSQTSADSALDSLNEFKSTYYGQYASAPTTDPLGNSITTGDMYFDTSLNEVQVYNGVSWEAVTETEATSVFYSGLLAATDVKTALDELESEKVEKTSDTGAAQVPYGTTSQRPSTDPAGAYAYLRYNSEFAQWEGSPDGVQWSGLGGATGGAGNPAFYENDINITADYTITTGKNAMTAGPVTIVDGVTVTVPDGSTWSIVG